MSRRGVYPAVTWKEAVNFAKRGLGWRVVILFEESKDMIYHHQAEGRGEGACTESFGLLGIVPKSNNLSRETPFKDAMKVIKSRLREGYKYDPGTLKLGPDDPSFTRLSEKEKRERKEEKRRSEEMSQREEESEW